MATITTRSGKGSPLTNNEVDANFNNLNTDKAELSGATFTGQIVAPSLDISGDIDVDGTTNLDVVDIDGAVDMASTLTVGSHLSVTNGVSSFTRTHATTNASLQILDLKATSSGDMANGFGPSIHFSASDTGATSDQVAEINVVRAGSDTAFNLELQTADATRMTIGSGGVDVSGVLTANAGVVVDNITIDGQEIDVSSGDLTLDIAGNINLDADGGEFRFKDGGTLYATAYQGGGGSFYLASAVQDKDLIFQGNDGGSTITALTLDMSAGGTAYFADDVRLTDNHALRLGNDGDIVFYHDNSNGYLENGTGDLTIDSSGYIRLDADSSNIYLADGGTDIGLLSTNNQDLNIRNLRTDKDIYFQGNDGGSTITMLTLGASQAGAATFNSSVAANKISILATDGVRPNDYVASFQNQEATDSQSFGVSIAAGSTGSDIAFNVVDHDASNVLLRVLGNGATTIGGAATFNGAVTSTGNVSVGGSAYTTSADLNLLGDGVSFKNDKSGSNNNWSLIQNTATGGASNLKFTLGTGNILFGHGGEITTNTVAGYHTVFNEGGADVDFRVESDDNANMLFVDGGNNRVGVGTGSPSKLLHLSQASDGTKLRMTLGGVCEWDFSIGNTSTLTGVGSGALELLPLNTGTANEFAIGTAGTTAPLFHLTNSQNYFAKKVGIGNDSPDRLLSLKHASQAEIGFKTGSVSNGALIYYNDSENQLLLRAQESSDSIAFQTGGTTERMRIDSSGNLLVGCSTLASIDNTPSDTGIALRSSGAQMHSVGNGGNAVEFRINGTGAVGTINCSGSATSYNTSSDYRLKEDWQPVESATDRLKELKPVNFAWKVDGSRVDGFLAHELQEVVPEAVTGQKDAMQTEAYEVTPAVTDEEGNVTTEAVMGEREVPDYQGIDQSKLVPLLVATIQELEARITQLENN